MRLAKLFSGVNNGRMTKKLLLLSGIFLLSSCAQPEDNSAFNEAMKNLFLVEEDKK